MQSGDVWFNPLRTVGYEVIIAKQLPIRDLVLKTSEVGTWFTPYTLKIFVKRLPIGHTEHFFFFFCLTHSVLRKLAEF